jgi:hypothetical protein
MDVEADEGQGQDSDEELDQLDASNSKVQEMQALFDTSRPTTPEADMEMQLVDGHSWTFLY